MYGPASSLYSLSRVNSYQPPHAVTAVTGLLHKFSFGSYPVYHCLNPLSLNRCNLQFWTKGYYHRFTSLLIRWFRGENWMCWTVGCRKNMFLSSQKFRVVS